MVGAHTDLAIIIVFERSNGGSSTDLAIDIVFVRANGGSSIDLAIIFVFVHHRVRACQEWELLSTSPSASCSRVPIWWR